MARRVPDGGARTFAGVPGRKEGSACCTAPVLEPVPKSAHPPNRPTAQPPNHPTKDICLESEERAEVAARRAGLAEARGARAEAAAKEAQTQARAAKAASAVRSP